MTYNFDETEFEELQSDSLDCELPLELKFSIRKAELSAQKMTREQLYSALINLYYQRVCEWHALKSLLGHEQLDVEVISDVDLSELAGGFPERDTDEEDPFLS